MCHEKLSHPRRIKVTIERLRIKFTANGKGEIRICFLEIKSTKMRIVQTNTGL